MPCTTYLSQCEADHESCNTEIAKLLKDVNQNRENKFVVLDHIFVQKSWIPFKEPKVITMHSLNVSLGHGEFQILNFYCEKSESSINDIVSADLIMAYLYGALSK